MTVKWINKKKTHEILLWYKRLNTQHFVIYVILNVQKCYSHVAFRWHCGNVCQRIYHLKFYIRISVGTRKCQCRNNRIFQKNWYKYHMQRTQQTKRNERERKRAAYAFKFIYWVELEINVYICTYVECMRGVT